MQMLCKGLVVQARSRYGRLMLARVHLPPQPNRCITAAPMIIAIIIALVKSIFSSLDNFFATVSVVLCVRIYVMVWCPSVCLSHLSTAAGHCGGFAAVGPAGGNDRSRQPPATAAVWCTVANASSATSSADEGS